MSKKNCPTPPPPPPPPPPLQKSGIRPCLIYTLVSISFLISYYYLHFVLGESKYIKFGGYYYLYRPTCNLLLYLDSIYSGLCALVNMLQFATFCFTKQ